MTKNTVLWLLLVLAVIYIFGNIGTGSLTTWDEALYANISANILRTGDWLVLRDRPEKPWFDKPPLYMWCTAVFYKILPINEFSTRVTSGMFGLATVILVYIFVSKLRGANAALLSSLLLLAAPHFIHFSKLGMMDVMLTFFITLMLYFYILGEDVPRYLFFSAATLALAYLAKGFAAFLGPIIIVFYALLSGRPRLLLKRQFIIGILLSVFVILAWHMIQHVLVGPEALRNYFGFHVFQRATASLEGHGGGLNFYQKVIFNKNIPWGVLFYASIIYMAISAVRGKDRAAVLLCVWVLSAYVLYTVIGTKLHWYIMPAYPAFAMSSGIFLERFLKGKALIACVLIVLTGMIIQVPFSWAFRLDLNPNVKACALQSKQLDYEDNGTIFYYYTAARDRKDT